jgi:phage shock protein PspC (stress-responsive transcriptional regulator)
VDDMNRTDVQTTLRDMWETRPARPRDGRQVAGVALAIARRYDVDPVLVRVGFVVAAFSGVGGLLYIAGWLMLPDEPRTGDGQRPPTPRLALAAGLGIAALIGVGSLFSGEFVLPTLVILGLLFLLHRSRGGRGLRGPAAAAPVPGAPTATTAAGGPAGTEAAAAGSAGAAGGEGQTDEPVRPVPPSWDPLGAAPFAWDLPEPSAPEPSAPQPRRPRTTAVTLALALLAGGLTGIVMLLTGGPANLPILFGVVLTVLGAGLVFGAFTRSSSAR